MENTPAPVAPAAAEPVATLTQPVPRAANLPLAVVAGVVAAIVGAALWAGLTVLTERQFAYAAIGLGCLVGFGVRLLGKGTTPVFGVIGGVLSLLGCALGNLLSIVGFISKETEVSFFSTLANVDLDIAIEMMKATFEPIDLLFYGLAAYCGFKFGFSKEA
jgi:hypothetical protein